MSQEGGSDFSLSSVKLDDFSEDVIVEEHFVGAISGRVVTTRIVYFCFEERNGVVGRIVAEVDENARRSMFPEFEKSEGVVESVSKEEMIDSVVSLVVRDCRAKISDREIPIVRIEKTKCSEDHLASENSRTSDQDSEDEGENFGGSKWTKKKGRKKRLCLLKSTKRKRRKSDFGYLSGTMERRYVVEEDGIEVNFIDDRSELGFELLTFLGRTIDNHPNNEVSWRTTVLDNLSGLGTIKNRFMVRLGTRVGWFQSRAFLRGTRFIIIGRIKAITEEFRRNLIEDGYRLRGEDEIGPLIVASGVIVRLIANELKNGFRRLLRRSERRGFVNSHEPTIMSGGNSSDDDE